MKMDEDASENDKLKAHIKEMRRRLAVATIRDKQLRKELLEEDLQYMTVSSLIELVQDPTRVLAHEFDDMTKEVFAKMMSTVESCCLREAMSYHRLAGRSIFNFKGNRSCIRLETFYNRTYKESYYILYDKNQTHYSKSIKRISRSVIEHHTIPIFIHLNVLEEKFLPDNFDTFIRIVHDQLQAYVTKREILKEVAQLKKLNAIEIKYQSESLHRVEIKVVNVYKQSMLVDISFEDKSSAYPTNVIIRDITNRTRGATADATKYLPSTAMEFKERPMVDVLMELLQTELKTATFSNNNDKVDMEID